MTKQAHADSTLETRKVFLSKALSLCKAGELGAWDRERGCVYRDGFGRRCIIGAGLTDAQLDVIESTELHDVAVKDLPNHLVGLSVQDQFGLTVDQATALQSHHDRSAGKDDMIDFGHLIEDLLGGQTTDLPLEADMPWGVQVSFA